MHKQRTRLVYLTAALLVVVVIGYHAVGTWLGDRDNMVAIRRFGYDRCIDRASRARVGMSDAALSDLGFGRSDDSQTATRLDNYTVIAADPALSQVSDRDDGAQMASTPGVMT
jgi:hypothetical protein